MNMSPGIIELAIVAGVVAFISAMLMTKQSEKEEVSHRPAAQRTGASSSTVRTLIIVLLSLVGIAVALMVAALFTVRQTVWEIQTAEPINTPPHPSETHSPLTAYVQPAVWESLDPEQFKANEYPSTQAAMKSLARCVRETVDANRLLKQAHADSHTAEQSERPPEEPEPAIIKVPGQSLPEDSRENALQWLSNRLRVEFPDSNLILLDDNPSEEKTESEITEGTVLLRLSHPSERSRTAPWDLQTQQLSGQYTCDITTPAGTAQVPIGYTEKPWVETFDLFISAHPNQRYVVGYSPTLVSSEEEARQMARQDAIGKLQADIQRGLIVEPNESHVVDRFAQKLSRPYGDVWREAILFNVSESRMAPAVAAAHRQTVQVRTQQRSLVFSLAILFGVAMVICVILNLLTQGYYRNRLWIAAGVIVMIVVLGFTS